MHLSALLSIAALLITGTSASMPSSPFLRLSRRQFGPTPPACDTQCLPVIQAVTACGGIEDYANLNIPCLCTPAIFAGVVSCANCATAADPTISATDLQTQINTAATGCKLAGYDVGDATIVGGGTTTV